MIIKDYFLFSYRLMIRFVSNVNYLVYRLKYKKPGKPYNLIYINPFHIERAIENSVWVKRRLYYGSGFIKKGEWDKPKQKLQPKHRLLYECFNEVFQNGVHANETNYFKEIKNHSPENDKTKLAEYYMNKYGPMFELFSIESFTTPINYRDMSVEYYSIAIDEVGDFLFLTGKHRLALAKAAGMKKLPVNVAIRHHKWQKYRDQLYTQLRQGEITQEEILKINHPDLMDLIEDG
jgi:hypothetical protein